ncbi:hypothetical protein LEMLEM_LOCUS24117, partial [Lemmus lemmus]
RKAILDPAPAAGRCGDCSPSRLAQPPDRFPPQLPGPPKWAPTQAALPPSAFHSSRQDLGSPVAMKEQENFGLYALLADLALDIEMPLLREGHLKDGGTVCFRNECADFGFGRVGSGAALQLQKRTFARPCKSLKLSKGGKIHREQSVKAKVLSNS